MNNLRPKLKARLRHCSVCGKFSRNSIGEYVRKDRTVGYINQQEGEKAPVCYDCRDAAIEAENGAGK